MNNIREAMVVAKIDTALICPYCNAKSKIVDGKTIYPHRADLYHLKFHLCAPCNAYVGCHAKTGEPLGRLANSQLRAWKMKAHAAFDPIWKEGDISRSRAYAWLAGGMNIDQDKCHIGMFDVEQCMEVVRLCEILL